MDFHHFLYKKNPYGVDFPRYVSEIINEMILSLGFDNEKIDFSIESLNYIDTFLFENNVLIDENFINKNFLGFVAYVGEGFIRRNGGYWKMILNNKYGEIWEPHIVTLTGKDNFKFVHYIYDTFEEDYPSSIYSCNMFDD